MTATPTSNGPSGLQNWSTRRRVSQEMAAARSKRVKKLRIALPAAAGLLIVSFIAVTFYERVDTEFLKIFNTLRNSSDELKMMSPRFAGKDDKGRPFEVTAAAATQEQSDDAVIDLMKPEAATGIGTANEMSVVAKEGVYLREEQRLDLQGDVELQYGQGDSAYEFRTPSASITFEGSKMAGDEGIVGTGPLGDLEANAFEAREETGNIVFTGDVRVTVTPKARGGAQAPELRLTEAGGAALDGEEKDDAKN